MHTKSSSPLFSMAGVCLLLISVLVVAMYAYLFSQSNNSLFPTDIQQQHLRENREKRERAKLDPQTTSAITLTGNYRMAKIINENIDEPFPLYRVPKSARNRTGAITAPTETEESLAYEAIDEEEDIATEQEFQLQLTASNL